MQKQQEQSPKERFLEVFTGILYKLRYPLIGVLLAFLLFVITYFVVSEIRQKRIERSTVLVERVEADLYTWIETEDLAEVDAKLGDLRGRLAYILDTYPRLYASQRALFIQGRLSYQIELWDDARASFVELADRFPKSYLAPIALASASTAMERAENPKAAIILLERVVDEYSTLFPEIPAILFSLGRLNEQIEENEAAIAYYEMLLDEHPASGWTNLAQNRIIDLKIDGS